MSGGPSSNNVNLEMWWEGGWTGKCSISPIILPMAHCGIIISNVCIADCSVMILRINCSAMRALSGLPRTTWIKVKSNQINCNRRERDRHIFMLVRKVATGNFNNRKLPSVTSRPSYSRSRDGRTMEILTCDKETKHSVKASAMTINCVF